ncbi:hypothetical protein AXG93_1200s1000 [Marchantia polymorpha subsp. ruderalis]|uniref:Uncharacterized protein n=1 Tax=Marchantia polymorpha subsp. ruderalis TaxID=1480154 RepID=A0A176WJ42_MARPO|nr:hypothetical protein AXG93_1200s1000 [Marchantia polymorpha subsp. ruderalis]
MSGTGARPERSILKEFSFGARRIIHLWRYAFGAKGILQSLCNSQRLDLLRVLLERAPAHHDYVSTYGVATPYGSPSVQRLRRNGQVRPRRDRTPAARAPAEGQERLTDETKSVDHGQRLRRCTYAEGQREGATPTNNFGDGGQRLRRKEFACGGTPSAAESREINICRRIEVVSKKLEGSGGRTWCANGKGKDINLRADSNRTLW